MAIAAYAWAVYARPDRWSYVYEETGQDVARRGGVTQVSARFYSLSVRTTDIVNAVFVLYNPSRLLYRCVGSTTKLQRGTPPVPCGVWCVHRHVYIHLTASFSHLEPDATIHDLIWFPNTILEKHGPCLLGVHHADSNVAHAPANAYMYAARFSACTCSSSKADSGLPHVTKPPQFPLPPSKAHSYTMQQTGNLHAAFLIQSIHAR